LATFFITFNQSAVDDIRYLGQRQRKVAIGAVETQLAHEPHVETRNRKRLRPNRTAEWELRVGNLRVFYDVDLESWSVRVVAVGVKKGSRLIIRGEEFSL
jgi:mRNA-degrading endonuclease RelE of RelBE toxin-antitoxin system